MTRVKPNLEFSASTSSSHVWLLTMLHGDTILGLIQIYRSFEAVIGSAILLRSIDSSLGVIKSCQSVHLYHFQDKTVQLKKGLVMDRSGITGGKLWISNRQ